MLFLLILAIGLVGWISYSLLSCDSGSMGIESSGLARWFRNSFVLFLTGTGTTSTILFLAAISGLFFKAAFFTAALILLTLFFLKRHLFGPAANPVQFRFYLVFCLLVAGLTHTLSRVAPPYESILLRDDACLYVGTAFQLARSGGLQYHDPLVAEMTPEERTAFFRIKTGDYARFPGGVNLIKPEKGIVTFGFYHLLPVWIGFGIHFLGAQECLKLLSLFFVITLINIWFLARKVGGPLLGLSLPLILFFFYPQVFFARIPLSESLSQMLFLSGLWIFLGQSADGEMPPGQQRLAAMLFGNMFLARFDTLFFVPVSLVFIFSLIPPLRRNTGEWRPFLAGIVLFALLALYHQFTSDTYLFVYKISRQTLGHFWTRGTAILTDLSLKHPVVGAMVFTGICVLVTATTRFWIPQGKTSRSIRARAIGGTGIGVALLLVVFESEFRWTRFWSHFAWFGPIFPVWMAACLLIGLVLFVYIQILNREPVVFWSLLILMLIPGICYLDRAFMLPEQPWVMRRFMPITFPLFFLLSFGGWYLFLNKTLGYYRAVRQIAFLLFVLCCSSIFYRTSSYLFRDPIYQNVIAQVGKIAGRLPHDALLLIPYTLGGSHVQMPLSYMFGHDTLLIHFEVEDQGYQDLVGTYLSRQTEQGRPLMVVLQRPLRSTWPDTIQPVTSFFRGFNMRFRFASNIAFRVITDTPPDRLMSHTDPVVMPFRMFVLEPR